MSPSIRLHPLNPVPPHFDVAEDEATGAYPSLYEEDCYQTLVPLATNSIFTTEEELEGYIPHPFSTTHIPGITRTQEHKKLELKSRCYEAIRLGNETLKRKSLSLSSEISRSMKMKQEIREAMTLTDAVFSKFNVLHQNGRVAAASLFPQNIARLAKHFKALREEYKEPMLDEGLPFPAVPIWGKDNDGAQWKSINDFEILAACYIHESDYFLTQIANFCAGKESAPTPEPPSTPMSRVPLPTSVSEAPRRRATRFVTDHISRHPAYQDSSSQRLASLMQGNGSTYYPAQSGDHDTSEGEVEKTFWSAEKPPRSKHGITRREALNDPSDPSDGSDSDDSSKHGIPDRQGPRLPLFQPKRPNGPSSSKPTNTTPNRSYHFDLKLKAESVPQWDGNADVLTRWIEKVNTISQKSTEVFDELGKIVPTRFTGLAETWYFSNPPEHREYMEKNWSSLRKAIGEYWMNHQWLERQKMRANEARYREAGYTRESPAEFVMRKLDLIRLVYNYSETEVIRLIMRESPSVWTTILQPQFLRTIPAFQNAVKYHEEQLMDSSKGYSHNSSNSRNNYNSNPSRFNYPNARANLSGATSNLEPPQFPKDDRTVSSGKTPESIGIRPCRHCGSGKHWDRDCKYAKQGEKRARVNFIQLSEDELQAQEEYERLYYETDADETNGQQDF